MSRILIVALISVLAAGCSSQGEPGSAVVTEAGQVATSALKAYQAALGAAEQAQAAKAAPYVSDASSLAAQASTAPTLAALSADLLLDAAPYILVTPNAH